MSSFQRAAWSVFLVSLFSGFNSWAFLKGDVISYKSSPGVVQLRSDEELCSAVIVSDSIVLTAGHCLSGKRNSSVYISVSGREEYRIRNPQVYFAPGFEAAKSKKGHRRLGLSAVQKDLVLIKSNVSLMKVLGMRGPLPKITLNPVMDLENLQPYSVSFGPRSSNPSWDDNENQKNRISFKLLDDFSLESWQAVPLSKSQGMCEGDSGAPLLIMSDDQEKLLGILSGMQMPVSARSSSRCSGMVAHYVDLQSHACWIQSKAGPEIFDSPVLCP